LLAADLRGEGRLIAIDRDLTAREYYEDFRRRTAVQGRFLRGDFSIVLEQLADNGVRADAVLMDLGVSSMQIDRPERGFSYAVDAPLDMRMDPSADESARELVNEASERDLTRIFRHYGEERYAKQIARAIVRRRRERPLERTGELVDVIKSAIPAPARFGDGHPAKRVFQALRIAVNDELGALEDALPAAVELLNPGGRLAVISFHSLEDRIVKQFLRDQERGCTCPPDFPVCVCGQEPVLRATPRRAIRPSAHEIRENPRAASARLRAAVKV
jgi:16S rRNA (cytosine1402-N4)-methyltransferase